LGGNSLIDSNRFKERDRLYNILSWFKSSFLIWLKLWLTKLNKQ
jgi:hypothetical protein